MNLILLGPPGAGKGTQAQRTGDEFGIPHIATGDILRAAVAAGTEFGLRARPYLNKGQLVPDEVVEAIAAKRLAHDDCREGWVLDGFPRTAAEADALDRILAEQHLGPIDRVLYLKVSADEVVRRISGRRVCRNPGCDNTYHVEFMPPKVKGVCDRDGCGLVLRKDDRPEVVRRRLEMHKRSTGDLVGRYGRAGLLIEIPAEGRPEEVTDRVLRALRPATERKTVKFCTAISCMDGRVQLPMIHYLEKRFGAEYVDTITEPAPNLLLARQTRWWLVDSVFARLEISIDQHHSVGVAIVGHADCAGNPASKEDQVSHIKEAVRLVCRRHSGIEVIGLWVDENWEVTELPPDDRGSRLWHRAHAGPIRVREDAVAKGGRT